MIICICDDSGVQNDLEIITNVLSLAGENTVIDITEVENWKKLITKCDLLFVINRYELRKNTFDKIKFANHNRIQVEYMCGKK